MRAIGLLSGGLDSTLALKLILEQQIQVTALNFVSLFCTCTPKGASCSAAQTAVRQLGIDLKTLDSTERFLEVVKHPEHGYGSQMNPCLDCRILMFRSARDHMREVGARFVVTGEVLGERPMSQRRDAMRLIEREAGLSGLVVRPLCAQHLEPSIPEKRRWVDRQKLLDIRGRCRAPQLELAGKLGIGDYPCPAGGCRLTDPGFAGRMRDLLEHSPEFGLNDVKLLRFGRHLRMSAASKAVVGRDEQENEALARLARASDLRLEAEDVLGPLTLLRGEAGPDELEFAAAATARYGQGRDRPAVDVRVRGNGVAGRLLRVAPATDEKIAEVIITPD